MVRTKEREKNRVLFHSKARGARLRKARNKNKGEYPYDINLQTDYAVFRKRGCALRENMNIDLNGLVVFQSINKIKEMDLRRRVAEGKKIRVAFYLDSVAKFTAANVYKAMRADSLFEPFVVLYHLGENGNGNEDWQIWQNELKYLENKGYNVFAGYDEKRNFIPLETFRPDIVFVSAFYLDLSRTHLSNTCMNVNFLVCQMNYGFNVINNYEYHFNNRAINTAWKYFSESREDVRELACYSACFGLNVVYSGAPRLDDYAKTYVECQIPDKINNGNPIVIYAPHWTIKYNVNVHDLGTFDLYHQFFFDLAKSNPAINFVFKPHPSLGWVSKDKLGMTRAMYEDYISEWKNLPNGLCVSGGDYIDLFRKSALLITDSASFIFEWLPSGHPCVYLGNPRRDKDSYLEGFTPQARKILETYYICWNISQITDAFEEIMRGRDPKAAQRQILGAEIFPDIGNASGNILRYLKNILRD